MRMTGQSEHALSGSDNFVVFERSVDLAARGGDSDASEVRGACTPNVNAAAIATSLSGEYRSGWLLSAGSRSGRATFCRRGIDGIEYRS